MKKEKVILTFLAVFIVCTLYTIVYADHVETTQATKVQYPIIVDDVQVNKEIPIISIEDRIYLPVRTMCDILNIEIEWKDEGVVQIMTNKEPEILKDFNISKDMALEIADIIFTEKFGRNFIENTQISVEEVDGTYKVYRYEVYGCLKIPTPGGDGSIIIDKKDGRIINITAGE